MKVGWVGLGKLGLPCALVLSQHHEVHGYDVRDWARQVCFGHLPPPQEAGIAELLDDPDRHPVTFEGSITSVVSASDVVFVAVQTPHAPAYGGEVPVPVHSRPRDFEYGYLVQACREVCAAAAAQRKHITLVVVSTVLPGTMGRLVRPLAGPYVRLAYSPLFIAMGTTIADFRDPEFVICGTGDRLTPAAPPAAAAVLERVLAPVWEDTLSGAHLISTSIETAEAIKVLYNTFISAKVVWANTVMELCHKTGADCDEVVDALSLATGRVISPKYMRGGMGDGGPCHPRDLVAMSWLAGRLGLSYNLFADVAHARQAQTLWLAKLVEGHADLAGLPIVVLGKAYKPESDLVAGSPALLLRHYLEKRRGQPVRQYDPYVDFDPRPGGEFAIDPVPAVYVIATKHAAWTTFPFPAGSVVVDPFGYIPDRQGVVLVKVGRKS